MEQQNSPAFDEIASRLKDSLDFREDIYLIESPSPADLMEGRNEGDAISRILRLAEIDVDYFW